MKLSLTWKLAICTLLFGLIPFSAVAQSNEKSADPRIQEAETLHQAGYKFFIERYRKAQESFQKELPLRRDTTIGITISPRT